MLWHTHSHIHTMSCYHTKIFSDIHIQRFSYMGIHTPNIQKEAPTVTHILIHWPIVSQTCRLTTCTCECTHAWVHVNSQIYPQGKERMLWHGIYDESLFTLFSCDTQVCQALSNHSSPFSGGRSWNLNQSGGRLNSIEGKTPCWVRDDIYRGIFSYLSIYHTDALCSLQV